MKKQAPVFASQAFTSRGLRVYGLGFRVRKGSVLNRASMAIWGFEQGRSYTNHAMGFTKTT